MFVTLVISHSPVKGSRMPSPHLTSLWPHLFTPFAQKCPKYCWYSAVLDGLQPSTTMFGASESNSEEQSYDSEHHSLCSERDALGSELSSRGAAAGQSAPDRVFIHFIPCC